MKKKVRRGLKKEVRDAFGLAIDMCGSFHPDVIDSEQRRLRRLRTEVIRALGGAK